VESPFNAQVPRDGSLHRIDIEGPGLQPETRMVSYDKDVTLDIVLGAAALPVESGAPTASAGTAPTGAGPAGTPQPWRRPDPKRDPNQPLEIDEQDPYKQ